MGFLRRLLNRFVGSKEGNLSRPKSSFGNFRQNARQKDRFKQEVHTQGELLEIHKINLDTSFCQSYSEELKRISREYISMPTSDSEMPMTFTPIIPDCHAEAPEPLSLLILNTFNPCTPKPFATTVKLAADRKKNEALFEASFRQQLQESEKLLRIKDFAGAQEIASKLALSVSDVPKRAKLHTDATALICRINESRDIFIREEQKRIKREQEEQERRRRERERQNKKQVLYESIDRMLTLAESDEWSGALELRKYLIDEISAFGDQEIIDKLKSALSRYEDIQTNYKNRLERIRLEKEALIEQKRREAQERKILELQNHFSELLTAYKNAAQSWNWSECIILKSKLDQAVVQLNDDNIKDEYDNAKRLYNSCFESYKLQQKQEQEQREKQEKAKLALAREKAEKEAREKAEERRNLIKSKYLLVQLPGGGECICLHRYYSKSSHGENVSQDIQEIRNLIYAFKDKFNNKPMHEINRARAVFCDEVSTIIRMLYADELSDIWFCTAQASTPESTLRRFSVFCEKVSNACGVKNGFELIKVTGSKSSASTGGGVRGDISHLSIDASVRGKKIILFDDIITSGKSLSNLRTAIFSKGAARVDCIVFGRTV